MARQMNVESRVGTLRKAVENSSNFQQKASQISEELIAHYKGGKTPQAKQALRAARVAKKIAKALDRVTSIEF